MKIALLILNLFSASAFANAELDRCGSLADRKLKAVVQSVAFPAEYIQWNFVDRIERTSFENTTPGSMYQEYNGTYRLIYKPAPYAYYAEQTVRVEFESPFVCDDLKLKCVELVSSKTANNTDPSSLLKTGPLSCGQ